MDASGSVEGKCYRCCFCSLLLSSIFIYKKSEKCSLPSCLRASVTRQDKPSLAVMGLTTDDHSALHYHLVVSWFEPHAAGEIRWKYSKEQQSIFWCWEGNNAHSGHVLLSSSWLWSGRVRGNNLGMWERSKWEEYRTFRFSVPLQNSLWSPAAWERMQTSTPKMPVPGQGSLALLSSSLSVSVLHSSHLQKEMPALADLWLCLCWQRVPELIYSTCSAFSEQQMHCLIIHGRCIIAGN